jgi:hypothetical protein
MDYSKLTKKEVCDDIMRVIESYLNKEWTTRECIEYLDKRWRYGKILPSYYYNALTWFGRLRVIGV